MDAMLDEYAAADLRLPKPVLGAERSVACVVFKERMQRRAEQAGFEDAGDSLVERIVAVFKRRHMRNDEFFARHSEFDADMKWLAAPMMRLDDHAAARDAVEILVELIRFLPDPPPQPRMRPYFGRSSALAGS